jgi:hypothetical protein
MNSSSLLFLSLFAILLLGSGCATAADSSEARQSPPIKLRGYGTLSGAYTPSVIDGKAVSILKITCDDESKARLVQAKYLSDLQVLPGIKPANVPAKGATLAGCQADDGNVFLAGRKGNEVHIYSGPSPEIVGKLIESDAGVDISAAFFTSDVTVPMFLDRFDKYGFRFYYGPFVVPDGVKNVADYDPTQDFEFAEKTKAGIQVWHTPLAVDNAEDITNLPWIEWAVKAAQKRHLPIGINDGLEHATWAYNRYPEQMIQYQPGFLGGWYGSLNFSEEITSWNGLEAKDQEYGQMQKSIRHLMQYTDITSWLEPHEEMSHGAADLLLEYGPVADAGYRAFLQEKYKDVETVSHRWYGNDSLKSWDDVHSPELASFLGWGPDAIDLAGPWQISYEAPFTETSAAPSLDDSTWATITAPGHAIARFLQRKPAVYRRHLTVDPAWRAAHPKVWFYCWDMNSNWDAHGDPNKSIRAFVNGGLVPETPVKVAAEHWMALDISKELTAGDNLIAVTLPQGMFNYRAYLSPHEPRSYPNLGVNENARWVDFYDWNVWFRGNAVRRGSQMIRQVDPNSGIMLMAPHSYVESISDVAKAYGGDFHDTGAMAGFWLDEPPSLAQGMGLPVTSEPGGPAKTVPEFKAFFGRWLTEGTNAIDYFQHEGDILWNPEIKKYFEDHLSTYTSVGKYHTPVNSVAALYSVRNNGLLEFPWGAQGYGSTNPLHLGSGYSKWNVRAVLRGDFESDAITESSFARGDAARYKVILDTNTEIMDPPLVDNIEKYVRDGGTFVTFVQTGRHSSTQMETWPIEKLTGYHVTRLVQEDHWLKEQIRWARDQKIFSGDWIKKPKADGMSMKKVADDAQDLAYWDDGSVAIGMRQLGNGKIIEVGCRFTSWGLPDRIDRDIYDYLKKAYGRSVEYGLPLNAAEGASLYTPELRATGQLFGQILDSCGVERVPGQLAPASEDALLRHYVSNSGLYDVWVIWNQSPTKPVSTSITLQGIHAPWALNLLDGKRTDLHVQTIPVQLDALDSAIYITPRDQTAAAQDWFDLQRRWWQGTEDTGKPIPAVPDKLVDDLTSDWAFSPSDAIQPDVTAMAGPKFDDSKWARRDLGIYTIPDYPTAHDGMFRKTFTVPADWNHGRIILWMRSWVGETFIGKGRIFLDGKLISDNNTGGIEGDELNGAFTPGSTHTLAIDISGPGALLGSRGNVWLAYHPEPVARQDLAGEWEAAHDMLRYETPILLPGIGGAATRRTVKIDAAQAGRTVVVHAVCEPGYLGGVIVNGHAVVRFHHNIGREINLNITPWVKFGQDNEMVLVGSDKVGIKEITLEFHDKGTYP